MTTGTIASSGLTPADVDALAADLAPADAAGPGLGREMVRYVLTGEQGPLLAGLAGIDPKALSQALVPFAHHSDYGIPEAEKAAREAAHAKRIADRRRIFALEGWDPVAMLRYGELLAIGSAARGFQSYGGLGSDRSPPPFSALLRAESDYAREIAPRMLTAPRCAEMLGALRLTLAPLVDGLFCDGSAGYEHERNWAFARPGLAETLAGDPPGVLEGMAPLDVGARAVMIGFVGTSGLVARPAFLEAALDWAADGARPVRQAALAALGGAPPDAVAAAAEARFGSKAAGVRLAAVRALVARLGAASLIRLDAHAGGEKAKAVLQEIAEARAHLAGAAGDGEPDGEAGYRAADGRWIAAPPRAPLELPPLAGDAAEALGYIVDALNAAASAAFEKKRDAAPEPFAPTPAPPGVPAEVEAYFAKLNADGEAAHAERWRAQREWLAAGYRPLNGRAAGAALVAVMDALAPPAAGAPHLHRYFGLVGEELEGVSALQARLLAGFLRRPDVGWHHVVRLMLVRTGTEGYGWPNFLLELVQGGADYHEPQTRALADRIAGGADLRDVADLLAQHGVTAAWMMRNAFSASWSGPEGGFATNMTIWPILAGHLDALDVALGVAPGERDDNAAVRSLCMLRAFPALPARYLKPVLDHAMAGDGHRRAVARALVGRLGERVGLIAPLLAGPDAGRRVAAARWLGELRDPAAVPALRAALNSAKALDERAALITALAACGDALADLFAEDRLLEEARAGLKKTAADYSELFDAEALPALHWDDGRAVAPEVVRWWFASAHKLKRPGGDPLLHRALDRLARPDAAALGLAVLSGFVRLDTLKPGLDEAEAAAAAGAATRGREERRWREDYTDEQAHADIRRETLATYEGSALPHRGLLALARHAPGAEAAGLLRRYLRDHSQRTNQCKALIDALAANPAPAALQAVVAASRRNKTPGVQRYAGEAVARVAADRGWTADALADRAVPTCGLDEAGGLDLPVAGATYRAVLRDDAAVELLGPAGRPVKALPAGDGDELKAAKAALSALRKEAKPTVEAQTARLREAMCAGRVWPAADFAEALLGHPIVGRLARRLVLAGFDAAGAPTRRFRALADGGLTGLDDAPVGLAGVAGIGIAHRATLDAAEAAAWATHLSDYEVVPLFEQLDGGMAEAVDPNAGAIDDRLGFMVDSAALRAAAARLGYTRSSIEDGGAFYAYEKVFGSLGIGAVVGFTGSHVPEPRSHPCALTELSFSAVKPGGGAWGARALPLGEVPPVLIAECRREYRALAAAGTGFDPAWKAKT